MDTISVTPLKAKDFKGFNLKSLDEQYQAVLHCRRKWRSTTLYPAFVTACAEIMVWWSSSYLIRMVLGIKPAEQFD